MRQFFTEFTPPRNRRSRQWVLIALSAALGLHGAAAVETKALHPKFDRDVRPILSENCFPCHGADANKRKAKLRLDVPNGTTNQEVIVVGKPELSELIKRITSTDDDEKMPPPSSHHYLTDTQRDLLRAWIKDGANYEKHWSFQSPVKPPLPSVKLKSWPRNDIDQFILARLETESLSPSPRAPISKLLRRVSLDLTGLPPTSDQLKRWLKERDPYQTAVTELLASPRYGERMAADWMDVARYADTHGFNNDSARTMWRWRDWVIDAFNRNLSYNQFLTEQLAGDLLEHPTLNQLIATGFNRNHVINSEGGIIDEEYRVEYVADRVQTTTMAWLGLTVGCARCHDHKFDPVTQKDFYQLYAFFNNNDECGEDGRVGNASPLIAAPTAAQQAIMATHRATLKTAETKMKSLIDEQNWNEVHFDDLHRELSVTNSAVETNIILAVTTDLTSPNLSFTNLSDQKPFKTTGTITSTNGPLGTTALLFNGESSLKSTTLKKFDSGKGWAFTTWLRRDLPKAGALFSTMNFSVPASSGSYGQGVEIRCTATGAVEVRLARRWPAYSINIMTRDSIPLNQWHNLLVTCDGSTTSRTLRVFIDGHEWPRDILHDNFPEITISGEVLLGASNETNSLPFAGALAGPKLLSRPIDIATLSTQAIQDSYRFAFETPPDARLPHQITRLRYDWLARHNPEFFRAFIDARNSREALLTLERDAPTTMIMRELTQPRPSYVLFRGQYDQPRDRVEPGVPEFLLPFPDSAPRNRLGLARWLTDPRHPLTARVIVNHLWSQIFGAGIVKSVEDFGYQADYPSHPELLDWLALEFIDSGWDVKKLVRLMVSSATYCQDSRSTKQINEHDPDNRLLARGPRSRLSAETLRDQALALSGLLHEEIGGPSVYPYQPANLYKSMVVAADYPGTSYTESKGADLYRRSLYTFWKRTVPHPTLSTFDSPDREVCVARRLRTNTPLQALALMNDPIQLEAARKLAERVMLEGGSKTSDRLDYAFQLATTRRPDSTERKALASLLEKRLAHYHADPDAAKAYLAVGASKLKDGLNSAELAAYANVTSLILNLDETITRN